MQNILVVMEKNSFLPMSMIEQLKELEYNTVSAELDIQELSKLKETFEVVLLFMESEGEEKSKELVYLRDIVIWSSDNRHTINGITNPSTHPSPIYLIRYETVISANAKPLIPLKYETKYVHPLIKS